MSSRVHTTSASASGSVWRAGARQHLLALGAPLVLGATVLLYRLDTPSLFVDEASSWFAAIPPVGVLLHRVHIHEVAPPPYYLMLHAWIHITGSDSEGVLRSLSVLAGLLLIALIYWLAQQLGGRMAGTIAATGGAVSPLVLEYGQEARAYIFAMAAVTLALAAAVHAQAAGPARTRWWVLSLVGAIAAPWFHYESILVVVPLAVWVWITPDVSPRVRHRYVGVLAVGLMGVAPFALSQLGKGHQGGVAAAARLNAHNLLSVLGTPFDGRHAAPGVLRVLAVPALLAALLWVARNGRPRSAQRLIVVAACAPVLAMLAETLLADLFRQPTYDALITRYTAVAAPFALVALGLAVASARRPLALVVGLISVSASIAGVVASDQRRHYPVDLRSAFETVAAGLGPLDTVVLSRDVAYQPAGDYYTARLRQRRPRSRVVQVVLGPALTTPRPFGSRTWLISGSRAVTHLESESMLVRSGLVIASVRYYTPGVELLVAVPPGSPAPASSSVSAGR